MKGDSPIFVDRKIGTVPGSAFAGAALALLLFLPAPILCVNVPWDVYAKRTPEDRYLASIFPAYAATQRLNKILGRDDGVLCTGCTNVYMIGGRPYGFEFWWRAVYHISDSRSFAAFCRRCGIRYWMVDFASPSGRAFAAHKEIVGQYWDDARLVTASGTVAVYDVASPNPPHSRPTGLPVANRGDGGAANGAGSPTAAATHMVRHDGPSDKTRGVR